MTRSLTLTLLVTLAGCGMAPTAETEARLGSGCTGGEIFVPFSAEVVTSSVDPWKGSQIGVVVAYGTSDSWSLFGVDDATGAVDWYMVGATNADLNKLESYPQSMRDCSGGQNSPGSGGSPKGTPDPNTLGICAPSTLAADAVSAYSYGPLGVNYYYCQSYGGGGCVPRVCTVGMCGTQANGCGGNIYCGVCHTCPCGGTYPRCLVCSTF